MFLVKLREIERVSNLFCVGREKEMVVACEERETERWLLLVKRERERESNAEI